MEELLIQNARTYAAQHQLCLAERLGFGIHGIVFVAENNTKAGKTAVKVHRAAEPFQRECAVYERLRDAGISKILTPFSGAALHYLGITGSTRWDRCLPSCNTV